MDLDIINIVTYVCAGLGVVLLFLCIILAIVVIYSYCRKHFSSRNDARSYSIVPRTQDPLDIEQAVLQRYHVNNDAAKGLSGLRLIDEVDAGGPRDSNRHAAPIKRKLFWKKKKDSKRPSDSLEDSRFSEEELTAGRAKNLFKKKRQVSFANRKKSKSDWYIYSRCQSGDDGSFHDSDEEDHEALLYPHQVISLIGSPVRPEELKQSQYFDALETIKEEEIDETDANDDVSTFRRNDISIPEESEADDSADDWTDVENVEDVGDEEKNRRKRKRFRKYSFSTSNPPDSVKRRVKALKVLQFEAEKLEAKFYRELFYLESEFNVKQRQPIHEKRNQVVNMLDGHGGSAGSHGIEHFWLHAMQNCESLAEIIQTHDVPILKFLNDVRIISTLPSPTQRVTLQDEHLDFRIEFEFSNENPFFENKILTKEYFLKCEPDPNLPFTFEGPEVVTCRGCKIHWRKGKNITLQPVKKLNKETGQLVTKFAKRNSFFNFFTPPKSVREWILDPKKSALMEAHFEIGLFFKETFVTKAILFYASHSIKNLGDDDDVRPAEVPTSPTRKSLFTKRSDKMKNKRGVPATSTSIVKRPDSSVSQFSSTSEVTKSHLGDKTNTLPRSEDPNHTRPWKQLRNGVTTSHPEPHLPQQHLREVKPDLIEDVKDPIIGRYRLVSSEGFDDFLRALGVGLVKRKLANSVSPIIVINVDKNGSYTVRTETHLSTVEQNFRLNEPFPETTMDGRTVQTTATRHANTLILNQIGDFSKGDKSTQLIREFEGKLMNMTMKVDSIICKRFYQKIDD